MTRTAPLSRRGALALGMALALAGAALPAAAQTFPDKPLKLIVNFPPGGAADVIGRAVAQAMGESLKQQVIVENRPGANGNIGAEAVAKSPADGYTLLMSSGGAMTVNPFLYRQMPFDAEKDLVPVASVARVLVFLMAHPSVPANSVAEFVAYAKAHPGKLSYGSAGQGSSPHLAAEMFTRQAGIQATHVPYRGAAPALTDLLAGQVQFMFDPGPGLKHAAEGKLRLLAVGSPQRASQLPNTPTLAESGFPGFDADTVFGIYAPGGTPAALVARLHDEVNKAVASAKVQEVIKGIGGEPLALTRQAFIERQNADRARFGKFIQDAGIKAE
ncbi:tripartite tricarboxylate transporter substrate binding protein [Calidifontimicrobium sp. SYSU G02091]|uniref:Bug family tripartite tricarboxylate transporter substrate binding protein n=1 Tax=Azohydromonas TaxID=312063 RepID=UPI000E65C57F|nr:MULTISPECIES: tripartite tricarboxylate transporter substrate binding protein [Azohydromonas]MCI1192198.1 tripartite tricarboxylate transporter substrate binding protein [Calidifontimicrobium sp. SYSU G02091]